MYFLFFRERRGREKKGEKHQCARGKLIGCLSHAPYWGPGPQPRHVPWLGTRVVTLWFIGWHSIHSATPARTLVIIFKKQYKFGLRGPESGEDRAGRAGKRSSLGCGELHRFPSGRVRRRSWSWHVQDAGMFRMLSSGFEDDPFFSDSFNAHRESMRQMIRSFSEPFGRDLLSISDGRRRAHNRTGRDDGENHLIRTDVNPFQAMDRMMLNMRNSMQELQRNFVSTKKIDGNIVFSYWYPILKWLSNSFNHSTQSLKKKSYIMILNIPEKYFMRK